MNKLDNLRNKIDAIDGEILNLISKRLSIAQEIARYKAENKLPFLDLKRKKKMISDRTKKAKILGIPKSLIKEIYEIIHDASLKAEEKIK
jgi:chorismate mutase